MIVGLDAFGYEDGAQFCLINSINDITKLQMQNGIYDEIFIDENPNIAYNTNKENWTATTVINAKFQNNLEAGNMTNNGIPIEKLRFKKRKISDFEWQNQGDIIFEQLKSIYQFVDKFVCSGEQYEYAVVPVTGGIEGKQFITQIDCEFDGLYLVDSKNEIKLLYNLEIGNIQNIIPNNTYETLGSKYPIIHYNGSINYKRGSIKALLISDEYINNNSQIKNEKQLRENIINFLTDKKPKILKDFSGNFMCVSIVEQPQFNSHSANTGLYKLSFEWVEIADAENYANNYFLGSNTFVAL